MKGYSTITKGIVNFTGNDKLQKIMIYGLIKSFQKANTQYKTIDNKYVSDITYQQIEDRLKINVDVSLPSLIKETKTMTVNKIPVDNIRDRNVYTFTDTDNFFYIDNYWCPIKIRANT